MRNSGLNLLNIALLALGISLGTQAAVYQEVGGRVVIEAENFDKRTVNADDGHEWKIIPSEDGGSGTYQSARGGKYMQTLPDAGQNKNNADLVKTDPFLDFKVQLSKGGEYRLWLRWTGHDGASDSIYAHIVEIATPQWYRYADGGNPDDGDFSTKTGGDGQGWDGIATPDSNSAGGGEEAAVFNVPAAGTYTIRVTPREDGCSLDALILQLSSMAPPTDPGPAESQITGGAPQPLSASPSPGPDAVRVPFNAPVVITFTDGTTKLAANSVSLTVDGTKVTPTMKQDGLVTTFTYVSPSFFKPNSVHTVALEYSDDKGAKFNQNWSFTVQNYNVIPAAWAVTADTTKPGFKARVHQLPISRFPGDANSIENGERQLANGYIDPATGQPYANIADLSAAGPGGIFIEEGVINYNQDAPGNAGNFNAGNGAEDKLIPGIPGTEGGTDNIAAEFLTYLELPAGLIRMGVNSDDGFKTSVSPGDPRDQFGITLGQFNGGRGAADTLFSFVVEKAGVYAFRTSWWEGGGGANVEWFTMDGSTRKLINDKATAGSIKAYREAAGGGGPYARKVSPGSGASNVSPEADIEVEIVDQGTVKVVASAVKMKVDGADVTPTVSKAGDITSVKLASSGLLAPASVHAVELSFGDGTAANTITRSWSFTVADYPTLPVALGTAVGSGTGNQRGFRVRTHQVEASQANSDGRAERQLAGSVGANVADLSAAVGGFFVDEGVINYNQDAPAGVGNFNVDNGFEDKAIPGIPGTTGSTDNIAQEILSYIEFPTAGLVRMGVNSDDGFKVTVAEGASTNAVRLGIFDGGRGAADTLFFFNVATPGVYPLRLIWYEGGGGANVEWFTFDKAGKKVLINDSKDATALKAFRARANTPLPVDQEKPKFAAVKKEGAEIVIEWSGGGTLQSSDSVAGPWTDVAGATSPRRVTPTPGARFYRIRR